MMILSVIALAFGLSSFFVSLYDHDKSLDVHQKQIAFLKLELEKREASLESWMRYAKQLEAQVIDLNQQLKLKEANNA